MGFSTSGSLLLIFFGSFIALGAVYTATANTSESLTGAYDDHLATQNAIAETALSVDATYHKTDGTLTIRTTNTGSRDMQVSDTTVLVDGAFRALSAFQISTVDGEQTALWGVNTELRLENETAEPERVKVVTDSGVAETVTVDVADLDNVNPQTLDRTGNNKDSTIAFDIETTYSDNVTLKNVSIDAVENASADPTTIDYANSASLSELNITLAPDYGNAAATEDGPFAIDETIPHNGVTLGPDGTARYRVGEFRDSNGDPVAMTSTTVTVTIMYIDPAGVERTFTFTEGDF
ncbi:hypothetical protein [Halovenus salina]|uniref:Flagellin n=1 Tax=Halovenus salina TaxID=1510225 RepID=A0ABD5VXV0_9EURY|nr:hypothetical protein [Halovenus salina]